MSNFERASRLKLRFNFKGICTVEDLWDMKLEDLDSLYRSLNGVLKGQKEDSLLEKKSPSDTKLTLQIDIIKHIVATKVQELETRKQRKETSERKEKILSIIAEKQDKELYELPVDELKKLIDQ